MAYPRIASFKSHDQFARYLDEHGISLPSDTEALSGEESPFSESFQVDGCQVGNRFCILPMEGWDATKDGKPTDLTRRRWRNFGISGAKWIWGGEAVAVRQDGRANPNQLVMNPENVGDIESLKDDLISAHRDRFGNTDDLLVGLQLTHSGRWAKPNEKSRSEPRTVQRNPLLDRRLGITDDSALMTDDDLLRLIETFVDAAKLAGKAGFRFVDVKHCHGYLGHELLSGVDRPGRFGGSFENRTRFLREIVAGIQAEVPEVKIGVRVSLFDFIPFVAGDDKVGIPDEGDPRLAFGSDATGLGLDLDEPSKLMTLMESIGIKMVCASAGSPYTTPHLVRPAYFPPSDGYDPPEDPLVGVARHIGATAELKKRHPSMTFVGSGYTYLQDWLPHVGQAVLRSKGVDSVGLGRMVLSYPDFPADVIEGNLMVRKKVCRTFSDCTTAPRNGIISGCYPLDPFYKKMPERDLMKKLKSS